MMNLISLSPKTIAHITRGAVSFEQHYYRNRNGWSDYYLFMVAYPNGYGVSIFCCSPYDEAEKWDVTIFEGDCESHEDAGDTTCTTEEGVIRICDNTYFFN